jgi:hypothetical protein
MKHQFIVLILLIGIACRLTGSPEQLVAEDRIATSVAATITAQPRETSRVEPAVTPQPTNTPTILPPTEMPQPTNTPPILQPTETSEQQNNGEATEKTETNGTVYYVAVDEPGASDDNNGLFPTYQGEQDGPWLTIQHAANTMMAGDVTYIRGGTYYESGISFANPGPYHSQYGLEWDCDR